MTEAVAAQPRLFIGGVPASVDEGGLLSIMTPFGSVLSVEMVRRGTVSSQGCAMVLFSRWAEAEAAMEALDGTMLGPHSQRPLVVSLASPRKGRPGEPAEAGISPRKLFVGQVPRDATEEDLRPLFAAFGEIMSLKILRLNRGSGPSAGCAFVEFRKWAQAEAAMEAHSNRTHMLNSNVPLVVKFADARRKDALPKHEADPWQQKALLAGQVPYLQSPGLPGAFGGTSALLQGLPLNTFDHMAGFAGLTDPELLQQSINPALLASLQQAAQQQQQQQSRENSLPHNSLAALGPNSSVGTHGSVGTSVSYDGFGGFSAPGSRLSSLNSNLGFRHSGSFGRSSSNGLSPAYSAVAGGIPSPLQNPGGSPLRGAQSLPGELPEPSSLTGLGGSLSSGAMVPPLTSTAAPGFLSATLGFDSGLPSMLGILGKTMGLESGLSSLGLGGYGNVTASHSASGMGGFSEEYGGSAAGGGLGSLPGVSGGPAAVPALQPQQQGTSQWKLFVGQVPLEATEQDLWELFSPIGEVVELYVLRQKETGRSQGCAFVSFLTCDMAENAITALNGYAVAGGKRLLVKYCDRAAVTRMPY